VVSQVDGKVSDILSGLGFPPSDHSRLCSEFSGGWQMRIALARLLLGEPSLLLLDEPTNHLDAPAKSWLMGFLSLYPGTVLLVSHDEELLRDFRCTSIAELSPTGLELYRCDFDDYVGQREQRRIAAEAAYEAQQREVERLEGFIKRSGHHAYAGARAAL
jgi:ATP-binding cassette, subfamily F, member 3